MILGPAIALAVLGLVSGLVEPTTYTTTAIVEVVATEDLIEASSDRTEIGQQELATQAQILQSDDVAAAVVERLGLARSPQDVLRAISAQRVPNSRLLQVVSRGTDADEALATAVAFAETYLEVRAGLIADRLEQTRQQVAVQLAALEERLRAVEDGTAEAQAIATQVAELVARGANLAEGVDVEDVGDVVRSAVVLTESNREEALSRAVLGGLLGLFAGLAISVLRERLHRRVRDEEALTDLAGDVLLAGSVDLAGTPPLGQLTPGTIEDLRRVHATMRTAGASIPSDRLLVVPAGNGTGAAAVAAGLAGVAARSGRPVILIDGDLRDRELTRAADALDHRGLSELLVDGDVDAVAVASATEDQPALVPAGGGDEPNVDRLASPHLGDIVSELARQAAVVVVTPPLPQVADALWFLPHVDAVVLVARLDRTSVDDLQAASAALGPASPPRYGLLVTG